jgi:DNA-binding MarR family transcriptional regulator
MTQSVKRAPRAAVAADDSRPGSLANELRIAIMRTSRRLRTEAANDPVTPSQMQVLARLRNSSSTLRSLADREGVRPPSMTRSVAALVERGLVDRTPDPSDRRQVLVSLTDRGQAVLAEVRNRRTEYLARRLAGLTPAQRQVLAEAAQILQKMIAQ